jgi:protein TonB
MMSRLERGKHLERELTQEPIAAPVLGSFLLHGALAAGLVFGGILNGAFHHNLWGNPGEGGSISVNLVSNAMPLPADEVNQNVLATESPSKAAAEPAAKEQHAEDNSAIAISGKQKTTPQPQTTSKTQQHQPPAKQDNRAHYGEQSGSFMPRATLSQGGGNGPVSVGNGDFGSRFGWYVDGIKRKVSQNWIRGQVDPRTPKGATVQIYFRINRQGVPISSTYKISSASGSYTLDRSCLQATQRVDTFGNLPSDSHDQWLDVTYDCTY